MKAFIVYILSFLAVESTAAYILSTENYSVLVLMWGIVICSTGFFYLLGRVSGIPFSYTIRKIKNSASWMLRKINCIVSKTFS